MVKLQSENSTERNSILEVFAKYFQTFPINFFRNIFICAEKTNYIKDYIKAIT